MNYTEHYTVKYPAELFEEWVLGHAINDGVFYGNGKISVTNVTFDGVEKYVIVEGDIERRIDA